ncbi:DnaT-like ssDNA-binding domain-containing protein [Pseudomonas sp. RIT411]|uniref:DnaT-like ssDNA-binding domain-containing protein n=1 Tax=Pseudomonas sp. RIT411 TaxID=2202160 RepID=UPI000D37F3AB|nr:DnaT-like ssDNA-binding domain-containing protein [Pseudomonas sp. RIT 411]RAU39279.1 hypothetical protein DBY63_012435 [Pseudomonas sp. RIT 411]
MPTFQINDDEREALRGLPHLARLTYTFGLRPFMDYGTGIVGLKRGISWKSLAEELYVEPHQGIKGGEPSEKELRRALVWLQKVGLVGQNQADRRLVFPLLLAQRDQSARNKVGSKWADEVGREEGTSKPSNHAGYDGQEGREAAGGEFPKVGTPPVSGKDNPTPPPRVSPESRFPMHDSWEPAARTWKATAMRNGIGNTPVQPQTLLEFRSYWICRPDKYQSQGQWEHELAQKIIRDQRHAQSNPGRTYQAQAGTHAGGGRKLSAPEIVKHHIAERKAREAREAQAGPAGQALDEDGRDVRAPLDGEFWRHS